jgi:2-aminobenzoylacetyl-CoA thioesterase
LFRDQLAEYGVSPDAIKQIVIPHAHPDHVMAVPFLRTLLPNAKVVASEVAVPTLSAEKAVSFFAKLDDAVTDWLIQGGKVSEEHRRPPFEPMQIAVDDTLQEGDAVTVDGLSFQVLQTPGHSDCSLSFHEADQKLLIVSDALPYFLPDQDAWWPCYFGAYGAFVESMQRLAGLNAEVLCLGHHGAIRGADAVAKFFEDAINATETYHQRIVEETKAGKSPREIGGTLGTEMHERMQSLPADFFQKNCGLLAKLSLRHEGIEAG